MFHATQRHACKSLKSTTYWLQAPKGLVWLDRRAAAAGDRDACTVRQQRCRGGVEFCKKLPQAADRAKAAPHHPGTDWRCDACGDLSRFAGAPVSENRPLSQTVYPKLSCGCRRHRPSALTTMRISVWLHYHASHL